MDWIKQIIECKKENWESPGSLGQKIKKIRMLRRYTQKELGVMCGFSLSSADVRIAQYEKNKKIPREKILKAMCNALGVGEGALVHADMLSYQEMFYALFDMEDFHGLHPVKKEDGYYLRFGSDSIINDFLEEWYKMYQKYPRPRGDDEEEKYTLCRYEYPNEIAVVSQYELLKRKALQAEIENIDTVLNTPFLMEIHGVTYNDEKAAGEMLVQACTQMKKAHADAENIGSFWGFQMKISYSLFDNSFYVRLTREASFIVEVKKDPVRNIERILTAMRNLPGQKKTAEERLEDARQQLVQAKEEVQKPFEKEEELKFIQARLVKVNAELDVGSDEEKIQKDGKNRQEEQRICL